MSNFSFKLNGVFDKDNLQTNLSKLDNKLTLVVDVQFDIDKVKRDLGTTISSIVNSNLTKSISGATKTALDTTKPTQTTTVTPDGDIASRTYRDGDLSKIQRMSTLKDLTTEYYQIGENGETVLTSQIEQHNTDLKDRLQLQNKLNKSLEDMNYILRTNKDITDEQRKSYEGKLSTYGESIASTEDVSKLQNIGRELKTVNSEISSTINLNQKNATLFSKLTGLLETYHNQGKLTTKQVESFNEQLLSVRENIDATGQQKGFLELNNQIVAAANQTGLLGQSLTKAAIKYTTWLGIATIVAKVIRAIKSAIQEVENLDTALMELNKVSDLTKSQLSDVASEAYKIAEEVSSTGLSILEATTEFARMGYNIEESLKMGKFATIMTNIAEDINDASKASKILISVMKGLGDETLSVEQILDRFNEVSNNNAVSFGALAEMAQTSTATMATLGNTFDETIAMLTGAYEVLQDERVAKGLSTIGLRIAGLNEDMESVYGLSNEIAKSLQKYALINIFDSSGDLKTTYQIFSELAEKWDSLSVSVRSMLLNILAGKGRADVASALLQNWDAVKKSINDVENSTGSALKENQKYADSIKGIKEQIKNLLSQIKTNIIESEDIKILLEMLKGFLKVISEIKTSLSEILLIVGTISTIVGVILKNPAVVAGGVISLVAGGYMEIIKILKDAGLIASDVGNDIESTTEQIINGVKVTEEEYQKYDEILIAFKRNLGDMMTLEKENISLQKAKNDLLQKQKNLQDKILSVEKARADLEKAKSQRTIQVYRTGVGFVYEADTEAIEEAQEKLDKAVDDLGEYRKQYELERVEDYLTQLNELITSDNILDGWETLFDNFSDIAESSYKSILEDTKNFIDSFNNSLRSAGLITDSNNAINYNLPQNATGTYNFAGGLTMVGEHGAEIVNLPKGSEILNNSRTTSLNRLLDTGKLSTSSNSSIVMNFNGDLSFPNVNNGDSAKDFISAILDIGNNKLPNLN